MKDTWDVVVIGGGAAGMMSAIVAASKGLRVLLVEKNDQLGKKLRITGGGRCNITNATFDTRTLLKKYGDAEQFLFSTFSKYSVQETLDFFHAENLQTKTEAENRVFPASEKAEDVAETMVKLLEKAHVTIQSNTTVTGIIATDGIISHATTHVGAIYGKKFILATGGTSRPETGSTGDGYTWLTKLGHTVLRPTPSLVPITVSEPWVEAIAGLSIQDTQISIYQDSTLLSKSVGKVLFTHDGLSGPGILNQSTLIGKALGESTVRVKINTVPEKSEEELLELLRDLCITESNKKVKNLIASYVPLSLAAVILNLASIDGDRTGNTITRQERHTLLILMRALPLTVKSLLGPEKAIVASGGVSLTEVDFTTMSSRLYPNLFIVGDLLNIVRPSGGYSLQLCWTTGYVAGISTV